MGGLRGLDLCIVVVGSAIVKRGSAVIVCEVPGGWLWWSVFGVV